jgi:hypothetical protein
MLKEKGIFLVEKGLCKEEVVLKIVSNMERRDKDKPPKDLECCVKV